jgi:hypothetical protein
LHKKANKNLLKLPIDKKFGLGRALNSPPKSQVLFNKVEREAVFQPPAF